MSNTENSDNVEPPTKMAKLDSNSNVTCYSSEDETERTVLKICFPSVKKKLKQQLLKTAQTELGQLPTSSAYIMETRLASSEVPKVKSQKLLKKVSAKKYVRSSQKSQNQMYKQDAFLLSSENSQCIRKKKTKTLKSIKIESVSTKSTNSASHSGKCPLFSNIDSKNSNTMSHQELMQMLIETGAIDRDGDLQKIPGSLLTIKLVMAAINVFNFSYEEICMWVIKSRRTKYRGFNEKFSKQFNVYKHLYKLIRANIEHPNGKALLDLMSETPYFTPIKMSRWDIIFPSLPPLLENVILSSSIQEQSEALKAVCLSDLDQPETSHHVKKRKIGKTNMYNESLAIDQDEIDKSMDTSADYDETIKSEASVLDNTCLKKHFACQVNPIITISEIEQFLFKLESMIGLHEFKQNEKNCTIQKRMLKIEELLSLERKSKHSEGRHQILAQIGQDENNFKRNVSQLQSTLKYIKEKDVSEISLSKKQDILKKNIVHLFKSENKTKSNKISLLRSQVHVLENIVNHFIHQMQRQKRVNDILKVKLVSLEKCYFVTRSQLLNRPKDNINTNTQQSIRDSGLHTYDNSHDRLTTTPRRSNAAVLIRTPSRSNAAVLIRTPSRSDAAGLLPTPSRSDAIGLLPIPSRSDVLVHPSQSDVLSAKHPLNSVASVGCSSLPIKPLQPPFPPPFPNYISVKSCNYKVVKPKSCDVATQCELIFNDNAVLSIPPLLTPDAVSMAEVSAVKGSIISAANSTSRPIVCNANNRNIPLFKCVLERMILYELMLDDKAFLDLSLQGSSSVCAFKPCNLFNGKENDVCNGDQVILSKNDAEKGYWCISTNSQSNRSVNGQVGETSVNQNIVCNETNPITELLRNTNLWETLCDTNINQFLNDFCTYFLNEKNGTLAISKNNKDKLFSVINDKETFTEMTQLCLKVEENEGKYLRSMKEIEEKLNNVYSVKMKPLEEKFSNFKTVIHQYEAKLQSYQLQMGEYQESSKCCLDKVESFEKKCNEMRERSQLFYRQLNSIHVLLEELIGLDEKEMDSTVDIETNESNVNSKISNILKMISKCKNIKESLELSRNDVKAAEDLLRSCDTLVASMEIDNSQFTAIDSGHKNLEKRIEILVLQNKSITLLESEVACHKRKIHEFNEKLRTADEKMVSLLLLEERSESIILQNDILHTKLTKCDEEMKQKKAEFDVLTGLLIKERTNSVDLQNKLIESSTEIDKLVILWDVFELRKDGVQLDSQKYKASAEQRGLSVSNMSMLESITGWKNFFNNSTGNTNRSIPNDGQQCDAGPSVTSTVNTDIDQQL